MKTFKAQYLSDERKGEYMPIRLKAVLVRHNLSQAQWCKSLGNGRLMHRVAGNLLLNWGQWPKNIPPGVIREATENFLLDAGVPAQELTDLWTVDKEDPARGHASWPGRSSYEHRNNPQPHYDIDLPEADMLTQQAKKHFKLFRDPFTDDIQSSDDVFLSGEQHYIREAMFYTAKHAGFLAVIGESGAGKSTLRRDLIERINKEALPITVIQPRTIDKSRLTASAICDAIVGDLSREAPKRTLEGKARQVERLLTGSSRAGNTHVLIIEEAHDMDIRALKYLKRFWELEDGFKKLLAILLIGQPELKGLLDERQNWEAREVIQRCEIAELLPLDTDIKPYLQKKFARLQLDVNGLFEPDAYDAMRERLTIHTRGANAGIPMSYPLRVNNCVRKAMNLAAEIGAAKVSADIVRGV